MKLSGGEKAVLIVTALILALMGGYHLGSGRTRVLEPVAALPLEEPDASPTLGTAGQNEEMTPVDINTAEAEELMTLPGIGESKAQAILEYRAEHGAFQYVEELLQVPGIGEGILEDLMDIVTAGGMEHAENSGS